MFSKILVANWKMNPETMPEAVNLARVSDMKGVVVCPPFVFAETVNKVLKRAALGAQDVFWEDKGAYTGEISPTMLKSLGIRYVIIGHSERRRYLGEEDEMVNKKIKAAFRFGLKPVLCVGEPRSVRKKGIPAAKDFVKNQLQKDLANTGSYKLKTKNLIIAYEPVWAISTEKGGRVDIPEDAAKMIYFIKSVINSKVLYGGSVTSANVLHFLARPEIDGVLVGGASAKSAEFKKIIKVAAGWNGK